MSATTRPFWSHLLAQRVEATWGNFAWFSARTLLQSVNDRIAHEIEEPDDPGSIVDRRRMRWVAEQRVRGVHTHTPLRIPGTRGFLALGDPGEMDASQYVLLRDLSAATRQLRDDGIDTALLMSDVVYPAGDTNQWADAVYLPYFGLPAASWSAALDSWRGEDSGRDPFAAPLLDWHVLALPGNHDWYDGLNGFMYHACGAEPLPEVAYDTAGLTVRQRISRSWWRSPAAPKRELIAQLRHQVAHRHLVGIPELPGPYYAADLGCTRHDGVHPGPPDYSDCKPLFRLVVVDNGITGSIDVEQANWLDGALGGAMNGRPGEGPLPVVVVTGKPIVVNNKVNRMRVAERPQAAEARDVLSILQAHKNVVATIAGDIHNYQRIELSSPAGTPALQLVAGGAGAFLSAAHTVRLRPDGGLDLDTGSTERTKAELDPFVEPGHHHRYPSRTQSVLHFGPRLRAGYTAVLAVLAATGVGALALTAWAATDTPDLRVRGETLSASRLLLTGWLTLAWLGVAAALAWGLRSRPRGLDRAVRVSLCVVAGPVLLVAALALAGGGVGLLSALAAAGVVVGVLLAQLAVPVLQSYPRLRHSLVARAVVLALLVWVGWRLREDTWKALVLAALAVVLVRLALIAVRERSITPSFFGGDGTQWRATLGGLVPFAATAVVLAVATLVLPETLAGWLGHSQQHAMGGAVRLLAASTLAVTSAVAVLVGAVLAAWSARRFAPALARAALLTATAVGLAGGIAVAICVVRQLDVPTSRALAVVVVTGLATGLTGAALGSAIAMAGITVRRITAPGHDEVRRALTQQRDGAAGPATRSRALFTTMAVAGVPGLESMAEAALPPFAKNVLVVDMPPGDGAVVRFRAYGLEDESEEPTGLPTATPDPASEAPPTAGFFLVDEVHVDTAHRAVRTVRRWPRA